MPPNLPGDLGPPFPNGVCEVPTSTDGCDGNFAVAQFVGVVPMPAASSGGALGYGYSNNSAQKDTDLFEGNFPPGIWLVDDQGDGNSANDVLHLSYGAFQTGRCNGGPNNNNACFVTEDCYTSICLETAADQWQCMPFGIDVNTNPDVSEPGSSDTSNRSSLEVLKQIFAQALDFFVFDPSADGAGAYTPIVDPGNRDYDIAEDPGNYNYPLIDGESAGSPPTIRSIGQCFSGGCREGNSDKFTVNGVDGGTILGTNGRAHASIQFFMEANPNQMPIRNVVMNWGDGSQSGSTADSNYYKNRRGLLSSSQVDTYCNRPAGAENWGEIPDACDPNFFTMIHDFVCSESKIFSLPTCGGVFDESEGCTDGSSCYFTPRLQVKDNWGWCTGSCGDADPANGPAGTDCVDDSDGTSGKDECNFDCNQFASDTQCAAGVGQDNVIDPWINYNGVIKVDV